MFKTRPKPVEADLDQIAVLTCDVDGNPPADIVWIHEPTEKVSFLLQHFSLSSKSFYFYHPLSLYYLYFFLLFHPFHPSHLLFFRFVSQLIIVGIYVNPKIKIIKMTTMTTAPATQMTVKAFK